MDFELPTDFTALYEGLLRSVSGNLKQDQEYCAFTPRCGGDYSRGLMFYGRAANGWTRDSVFTLADLETDDAIRRCAERIVLNAQKPICTPKGEPPPHGKYTMCPDEKCDGDPMHWVKHRRENVTERRSQYFSCVKEITKGHLGVSDAIWHRHVAWSNLYKVAPQPLDGSTQPAGNPSAGLQTAQRPSCADILKAEIELFRPRCIVFLTEMNGQAGYFDHFWEYLTPKDIHDWSDVIKHVRATGKLQTPNHECNFILAQHPQGRSPSMVAKDVLMAIESFEASGI